MKQTTAEGKKAMVDATTSAVKSLLATQKSMKQFYVDTKNSVPMTKEERNLKAEAAVTVYHNALLPYVDVMKVEAFEKFIIGRTNLLKAMFDKLQIN